MTAALRVAAVGRTFDGHRVLHDVTLEVADGASLAVLGPSGSGKTTLLRIVAGLDAPDAGEVWLGGRLASAPGRVVVPPHARGLGFVFQSSALWPHMTVAQNVAFPLGGMRRDAVRARVAELLSMVRLPGLERRYPDQLSGGEARRVALARALSARPRLLLMDEPLTNLDADLRASLAALIDALRRESGAALVYVTHEAGEAEQVAGRVVRLEAGRIVGRQ